MTRSGLLYKMPTLFLYIMSEVLDSALGKVDLSVACPDVCESAISGVKSFMGTADLKSIVDLAALCHQVDLALEPVLASVEDDSVRAGLAKELAGVRKRVAKVFLKQFKFPRLSWKDQDIALERIRNVFVARLGLPEEAPEAGSAEWEYCRDRIFSVTSDHFFDLKMGRAIHVFGSHLEILKLVFDEDYQVAERLELRKYQFQWETEEQAFGNVRDEVSKRLGLPEVVPERGSEEWEACRTKIAALDMREVARAWNLKWVTKFIPSVCEALIKVFDEDYDVKPLLEDRIPAPKVMKHGSFEGAVLNVARVLAEKLNLPEVVPERGGEKWRECQTKISEVVEDDFKAWGLNGTFKYGPHLDMLIAAFDKDYAVADKIRKRRRMNVWESHVGALQNVRKAFHREYGVPLQAPELRSGEWYKWRAVIVNCKLEDFINQLRLAGATHPGANYEPRSKSYRDFLIWAFPEYELTRDSFSGFRRALTTVKTVASDEEVAIVKRYFEAECARGRQVALNSLYGYVSKVTVKSSAKYIDPGDQKHQAFEQLLGYLNEIRGEHDRYSLVSLWRMVNSHVRCVAAFSYTRDQVLEQFALVNYPGAFPLEAYSDLLGTGVSSHDDVVAMFDEEDPDMENLEKAFAPYLNVPV